MKLPTPSECESDGECVLTSSAHPLRGNQKDSRVCDSRSSGERRKETATTRDRRGSIRGKMKEKEPVTVWVLARDGLIVMEGSKTLMLLQGTQREREIGVGHL